MTYANDPRFDVGLESLRDERRREGKKRLPRRIERMMRAAHLAACDFFDTAEEIYRDGADPDDKLNELEVEDMQFGRWWRLRKDGDFLYVSRFPGLFDLIIVMQSDLDTFTPTVRCL